MEVHSAPVKRALDRLSEQARSRWERGLLAVLGLFGQFSGITKSLQAVANLGVVNPRLVYLGLYESFLSTLLGLIILLFASLFWLVLRAFYMRLPRAAEGDVS